MKNESVSNAILQRDFNTGYWRDSPFLKYRGNTSQNTVLYGYRRGARHFSTKLSKPLSNISHNISRYIESELFDLRYFVAGKHESGVIYMGDE
jgi:hypothetical protein